MMINSDMKQVNLNEVNLILEVLHSFVSQSIESRRCQEEEEVMSKLSPILSCFASVIQFVKTGCVKIPQDLVTQFLEVASILNIVNTEKKREWDTNRRDDGEDAVYHQDQHDVAKMVMLCAHVNAERADGAEEAAGDGGGDL